MSDGWIVNRFAYLFVTLVGGDIIVSKEGN